MARSRIRHNAGGAPTNDNGTLNPIPIVSRVFTSTSA